MRLTLAAVFALGLAACEPAAESPAAPEAPARPAEPDAPSAPAVAPLTAEGWGPLRIGMTRAEVEAALGPDADPEAVGGPDPESCDQFRPERAPEGLLVMIEEGVLTRISVFEPATLTTDRGFGVGASAADIKAAYGDGLQAEPHNYLGLPAEYLTAWSGGQPTEPYVQDAAARGIRYETAADARVEQIHVGGPSIQYVEGCL